MLNVNWHTRSSEHNINRRLRLFLLRCVSADIVFESQNSTFNEVWLPEHSGPHWGCSQTAWAHWKPATLWVLVSPAELQPIHPLSPNAQREEKKDEVMMWENKREYHIHKGWTRSLYSLTKTDNIFIWLLSCSLRWKSLFSLAKWVIWMSY